MFCPGGKGEAGPRVLMIKDAYGRWTFPKGQVESGETPEAAALREIKEETGVGGSIEADLGPVRYFYTSPGGLVSKTVHYYLVKSDGREPAPQLSEVEDARWVEVEDALEMNGYENNERVLRRAIEIIRGGGGTEAARG
ncbi:MAG: NUDIX domain-containing protein [Firmicutes bacterium]|nr:NUDIX domain-containing protein [Bacillota bacterium]